MAIDKFTNFTFNHVDQADDLYKTMTAEQVKTAFDSRGKEIKEFLDVTIDNINTKHEEQDTALMTHIEGSDHDSRYYTEAELNNGVLDTRYYRKDIIDQTLRGGDTVIKYEVFTIVNSNDGAGHFTYTNDLGNTITGDLAAEGYQIFTLEKGNYALGENRISLMVNDTLKRSVVSGGIIEIDETHIALTMTEGNGAEITIEYFERLGLAGEHGITHEVNGTDEISGLCYMGTIQPTNKKAFFFKVVG